MLTEICELARNAGSALMEVYYSDKLINISYKSDQSPVTNADKIANTIIKNGLVHLFPNIPILSEEDSNNIKYDKNWNIYWLVDPLDGTKEFLKKNGEFTVNISLIKYGIPILGVIYAPYFNLLYCADKQQAWKINEKGYKNKISIAYSSIPKFVISRSHSNKKVYNLLNTIKKYTIEKLGSSLKFCYVAEGKAQFYPRFGKTYIWDTAAGHAIVTAAGGKVITYNERKNLNYSLFSQLSLINPDFLVLS
ncbi:3'(2'),5'-bisphosphate nucleotidase [Buchnera aphidicola (Aphis helianthi)]|uniref:3'(2'),5'-bisphosphate nucleotidase CysQ n=1 Tax=Buchnera aphidicola (Aphis helianthi) TaxID=2315802 RepID=A0A4D6XXK0_9GAMM|nr:3'(2'),5'-bisphosphate nucleotidase CysQ [Buchnera aphidicola]QCI17355.1 3'(2'),5'-bisphosphate nucleotidase [Buchnera aphidicola (Aphis helianthi)]